VSHTKGLVDKRAANYINGIKGFLSFPKQFYTLTGEFQSITSPCVSKAVEYRFDRRNGNLFELFISIYFSYVSPLIAFS